MKMVSPKNFIVVAKLGEGTSSEVFLVRQKGKKKTYAQKRIRLKKKKSKSGAGLKKSKAIFPVADGQTENLVEKVKGKGAVMYLKNYLREITIHQSLGKHQSILRLKGYYFDYSQSGKKYLNLILENAKLGDLSKVNQ